MKKDHMVRPYVLKQLVINFWSQNKHFKHFKGYFTQNIMKRFVIKDVTLVLATMLTELRSRPNGADTTILVI